VKALEHAAVAGYWEPTIFGDRDAERVRGQVVSWEFFRTLGVRPLLGRDFDVSEDTPDTRDVVVLGYGLWQRRFGGDPAIVGKTINTSGRTRRVIGVMPASFEDVLDPTAQIWRPLGYAEGGPSSCRTCRHLEIVARMRSGQTRAHVQSELDAIMAR